MIRPIRTDHAADPLSRAVEIARAEGSAVRVMPYQGAWLALTSAGWVRVEAPPVRRIYDSPASRPARRRRGRA